jgi:uncharacterized protein involved in exopolysaccharide biosynthesis
MASMKNPIQGIEAAAAGTNGRGQRPVEVSSDHSRMWLLWDNRLILRRFTLWGLALATIFAFMLHDSYTSIARLMPPEKEGASPLALMAALSAGSSGGSGSSSSSSLGDVASDLLGVKSEGALVVEMLHGRTVEDELVQRFDLCKVYGVKYREDARMRLASHTDIAEDKKSGIVVIKVRDHDPKRAALMTQAYVEAVNKLLAAVSTSSARRERIFVEGRLKTVKQALDIAEHRFSEYASKNTAIDIPEQGKAMVEAAAILQGQLIAAESEVQGLSQVYTENNIRVRTARARAAELRKQLANLGGDDNTAHSAAESAKGDSGSDGMYPSIRRLPLLGVEWADLYRETKIEETVYELLTGQYELAKVEEAKEVPSIQAYDVGDVPERRSGPPRLLIMTIGTIVFFGLGTAWVLGRAKWENTNPDDPRKQLAEHMGRETLMPCLDFVSRAYERLGTKFAARRNGHTAPVDDEVKVRDVE